MNTRTRTSTRRRIRSSPALAAIHDTNKYAWYHAKKTLHVERRGKDVLLPAGTKIGIRPTSTNGTQFSMITQDDGPNIIYTLDQHRYALIMSLCAPSKAKIALTKPLAEDESPHKVFRPPVLKAACTRFLNSLTKFEKAKVNGDYIHYLNTIADICSSPAVDFEQLMDNATYKGDTSDARTIEVLDQKNMTGAAATAINASLIKAVSKLLDDAENIDPEVVQQEAQSKVLNKMVYSMRSVAAEMQLMASLMGFIGAANKKKGEWREHVAIAFKATDLSQKKMTIKKWIDNGMADTVAKTK